MSTKKGKYQNKSVYLNAALDLIKEHGIDKLTMRKMAKQLDVSPMAIYKHFSNKEELLKAVLDEFIANANVIPENDLPWQEWLTHVAMQMYNALKANNNWLPLLGSFEVGENALKITFCVIEKLQQAGFDNKTAVEAYLTMIHLVLGSVNLQASLDKSGADIMKSSTEKNSLSSQPFLQTVANQQIEVSLPFLLDGLSYRLKNTRASY